MTRVRYFPRRSAHRMLLEQLYYRLPMAVTEIHVFPHCYGQPACPVCPRCERTMEREYMAFCSRCGQRLNWKNYPSVRTVRRDAKDYAEHTIYVR